MHPVRHNADEGLRKLQRLARSGDHEAQERLYRKGVQLGDCELVGESLFDMGPELAGRVLEPPKKFSGPQRHELRAAANAERDNHAICLGLALVHGGYAPYIKVVDSYRSFIDDMQTTKPVWISLPASVPGRARRRRFVAKYGFSYQNTWGHPESVDRQSPSFRFELEPLGKHYQAEEYVRGLGQYEAARRIAPRLRFLARWDRVSPLSRSWGGNRRQDVAGMGDAGSVSFFWGLSDPSRTSTGHGDDPDARWDQFLRVSKAGVIPGEDVPPRAPDPYWTRVEIDKWVLDPKRSDLIRALFYADLWLAGLLVPADQVGYDPITGGPKGGVQENPWRRNADRDLRSLERAAAAGDREAAAALARARQRAGVKFTMGGKPLGRWEETDEESAEYSLNAVPPVRMWRGGHVQGEAYSSTPFGEVVWLAYQKHGGRYWSALVTLRDLDRYRSELLRGRA